MVRELPFNVTRRVPTHLTVIIIYTYLYNSSLTIRERAIIISDNIVLAHARPWRCGQSVLPKMLYEGGPRVPHCCCAIHCTTRRCAKDKRRLYTKKPCPTHLTRASFRHTAAAAAVYDSATNSLYHPK